MLSVVKVAIKTLCLLETTEMDPKSWTGGGWRIS